MQPLSEETPMDAPGLPPGHPHILEFLQRPEIHRLGKMLLVELVAVQLLAILIFWVASKAVAERDMRTFKNALKVWLFNWLLWLAFVGAVIFLSPTVIQLRAQDELRATLITVGTALTTVLLFFVIPMKVYVIGFIRALIFVILAFVMEVAVAVGVDVVLAQLPGVNQDVLTLRAAFFGPGRDPQGFAKRLVGVEAPDEIDRMLDDALQPIGPQPPLAAREAMVQALQQKLAVRKRALPPGDVLAKTTFQGQLDRYLQFLNDVKAERTTPPGSPAASPTLPKATPAH